MGAVFALFAGFYYWTPKIIGKTYNELLGKIHFWTLFVGVIQIVLKSSTSISEAVERELADSDSNDIDNDTLDQIVQKLPTPKLPDPNNSKNKRILDKLNNIPAEDMFIGIKDSKTDILLNIRNKAGVYMFFNLVNGDAYVGSSVKLDRRFRVHISCIGSVNLPLYNALNKHGLNNFVFLILQYCDPSALHSSAKPSPPLRSACGGIKHLKMYEAAPLEDLCLGLEQSYLDLYKPKYNILKLAGSSKGFKHSPETIAKLKTSHAADLHPRFGSKASDQQKLLTSLALKKYYEVHEIHGKGKKGKLAPQFGIGGTKITMTNELGDVISFPSINSARLHFRVRFNTISKNINKSVIIKGVKWFITTTTS
jgi:group I intron endonuclease